MKLYKNQFLDLESEFTIYEDSAVCILPFPYEGGITYHSGAARAPDAVIEASKHLELYDENIEAEPYRIGISTIQPPDIPEDSESVIEAVYQSVHVLLEDDKFIILVGGDHSVSSGCVMALYEKYHDLSVVQFDAHADLRETYNNSRHNHACVMSRIREISKNTLQMGVRSLSREEADRIKAEKIKCFTMGDIRQNHCDINRELDHLPDPVYITLDVDVFDWSVISSTGTPEPGGFLWDEGLSMLQTVIMRKHVVGFDIVELSCREHDVNSPFAVAKMIYKMIGSKLDRFVFDKNLPWPDSPAGPIFL